MTIANRAAQAELTDLQMHLLEHSFEWVAQDPLRFSEQLRKHLLRSHPEFVDLLEHLSIPQFQLMSLTSLSLLIHSLQNPEHMRVISQFIHDQDYTLVKQRDVYEAFYNSLMNVLSEICEDAWSPALQGAWKASLELTRDRIFYRTTKSITVSQIPESPFDFATRRVHSTALVVDDDEQVRKTLCAHFGALGYDCYEAENGAIALHFLEGTLHIDVVITDNTMPILNGLQLLKALAQKPECQHPPCILCSENLSRNLVEEALDLGAWAIISKPYSHEELQAAVMTAIQATSFHQVHRTRKEDS